MKLDKRLLPVAIASIVSCAVIPDIAQAQSQGGEREATRGIQIDEIIITARRRAESLQDVPIVVNVTTGEDLERLNLLRLEDVESVVPGLTLNPSGTNTATLRGVKFDTMTSGNNATVEFYLNDAHITSLNLFGSMFDIEQIEVLRGPQGTLRGRASPSGSITVNTRRPDLDEWGGHVNTTLGDTGGRNVQGALNIPLIEGKLGMRIAGFYDENEGNRVKSIVDSRRPDNEAWSGRISLAAEPTDNLSLQAIYAHYESESRSLGHVESSNIVNPLVPAVGQRIRASDRRAVQRIADYSEQEREQFNFQAEYRFGNHQINYLGAHHNSTSDGWAYSDTGAFFGPEYTHIPDDFGQYTTTMIDQYLHEFRLSSSQPLWNERIEYVVGSFYNKIIPNTDFDRETLIFMTPFTGGMLTPDTPTMLMFTPTFRRAQTLEKSVFANITYHLTEATEISAGARYIEFENEGALIVPALGGVVPAANVNQELDDMIYQTTLTHRFSSDLMAYASFATSWRPSNPVVGNFSVNPSPLELQFLNPPPEDSKSFEIGMKSTWLDNRLLVNATVFRQEFKNYPFNATGIHYISYDPVPGLGVAESVRTFNFVGAVPVNVNGIELEAAFQISERWNVSGVYSWAKGDIDDGLVPCNDYFPHDGSPDGGGSIPTVGQIQAVSGGENIVGCTASYRANTAPLWSASLQSEYSHPVTDGVDGYIRGQLSLYGDSKGDPANDYDQVDAYGLFNLFVGLRNPAQGWDLGLYAKNLTDTERVLSRDVSPRTVMYRDAMSPSPGLGISGYRSVSMTPEREFGLTFRWGFGSR